MNRIVLFFLLILPVIMMRSVFADNDPNRNVGSCIVPNYAKVLGIPTNTVGNNITVEAWKDCFTDVKPAENKHPDGDLQKRNKAIQFSCLKKLAPSLTNEIVDKVMNTCRPEGDIGIGNKHGDID
ncbi:hypothetical protein [uncultured Shewanella sp.]|uniref:hypothetical protein n=1 Tax=uncultured Shewanella sp. TaxID=173975 RepID=UPI002616A00C|nr:hypothetical protein [uncultured Shewanella sp.]